MTYKIAYFVICASFWFARGVKHHTTHKPALGDYCMAVACIVWGFQ